MDNDNKLVQKAADLYRSLRFSMKYRGLTILSAEAGNDAIAAAITAGAPYMAARCGATEMRTAADYLQNGGGGFAEKTRIDCAHTADLLALWNVGAEREVVRGCGPATRYTRLRALEPYYHPHPWSAALAGKRVLVVHPFKTTIERQYARRAELFPGTDILPQFADLRIVQAVQGLAGADTGYASWFDALAAMEQQMDAAPYDVAIIGAGAYGLPLAAHARDTGHAAIQMSGALQLLFGIRGKRWDDHPIISKLYNDAWVRPEETLAHKEKVEGGSYW